MKPLQPNNYSEWYLCYKEAVDRLWAKLGTCMPHYLSAFIFLNRTLTGFPDNAFIYNLLWLDMVRMDRLSNLSIFKVEVNQGFYAARKQIGSLKKE